MSQVDPRPQHGADEIAWAACSPSPPGWGSVSPAHSLPWPSLPSGSCDRVGTEDKLQAAAGGKKCRGSGLGTGCSGSTEA